MKISVSLLSARVGLCLGLLGAVNAQGAATTPKNPATEKAGQAVASTHEKEIPQSVFAVQGRNPFFPKSRTPTPVPIPTPVNPLSDIVLNGLTSPPIPTAMINGRTFAVGETGEVKLPNGGKLLIKCVEIKSNSAVIEINGRRYELHMRFGL